MPKTPRFVSKYFFIPMAVALWVGSTSAALASPATDARARYQQDLADCDNPNSRQDPQACRLEATRARAEAQRGGFTNQQADYTHNRLRRCDVHQGDARAQCVIRMQAQSGVQGSVAGGGILRESRQLVPAIP
ncbi:MAG: hypothetical protein KBG00_02625 [Rhodoferax sp.]|jgi:hypothetical protein|uniref:hypothetical protein n=1 Tax=Rhodoferax sp. TaxID=50421 RepID=UPI001B46601B|nr:hypothetical protein [Rhodoferax sp.]MBP9147649.1 hypothetical protein [Rhodoferax sp.]MBP9737052.1 hypothetical protein [Rhodoferax sp.]